jgi:uncharacterized membrane protein YphA (DoxX/SURF4 family)
VDKLSNIIDRWSKYVFPIVRIGVGCLFIVTGSLKLANPTEIKLVLIMFIYTREIPNLLSVLIPSIEVLLGLLLLLGLFTRFAAIHLNVLLVLFFYVTLYAIRHNINVSCGCFGGLIYDTFGINNLILQGTLFLLNLMAIFDKKRIISLDKLLTKEH